MGRSHYWSHQMTDQKLYISVLLSILSVYASANPPVIDFSHNMRILKLPNNTKVGSIIYRLKGTDADNDVIEFGAKGIIGNRLLSFKKASFYEADVYLKMPLEVSLESIFYKIIVSEENRSVLVVIIKYLNITGR